MRQEEGSYKGDNGFRAIIKNGVFGSFQLTE